MILLALALVLGAETLLAAWQMLALPAEAQAEQDRIRDAWWRTAAAVGGAAILVPFGGLERLADALGWWPALAVAVLTAQLVPPLPRSRAALLRRLRPLPWWLVAAAAATAVPVPDGALATAWAVLAAQAAAGLMHRRPAGASPLAGGAEIVALAARHGRTAELLQAPGASPPNAGTGGLGRRLHIVFYGDLAARFPAREVLAVAAHELAHRVERHHEIFFCLQAVLIAGGLALVSRWAAPGPAAPLTVLATAAALAPLGRWLAAPLLNGLRHRLEFRADAFAARAVEAEAMCAALQRLKPDEGETGRLYALFHEAHPRTAERTRRLRRGLQLKSHSARAASAPILPETQYRSDE